MWQKAPGWLRAVGTVSLAVPFATMTALTFQPNPELALLETAKQSPNDFAAQHRLDQCPACATIAVGEGVDRLELRVCQRDLR